MRAKLTDLQAQLFNRVHLSTQANSWYRARGHGERVTLASLHSHGLVQRRAWRGLEGNADAAYEYKLSQMVLDELAKRRK